MFARNNWSCRGHPHSQSHNDIKPKKGWSVTSTTARLHTTPRPPRRQHAHAVYDGIQPSTPVHASTASVPFVPAMLNTLSWWVNEWHGDCDRRRDGGRSMIISPALTAAGARSSGRLSERSLPPPSATARRASSFFALPARQRVHLHSCPRLRARSHSPDGTAGGWVAGEGGVRAITPTASRAERGPQRLPSAGHGTGWSGEGCPKG
eukprot:scaffold302537_cov26-Tisochrysis_lutea.AAC.1